VTTTLDAGSTLGVLARQEIRNYLRSKLFVLGGALTVVAVVAASLDDTASSTGSYGIIPAALLGLFGLVIMFGLTRRSDQAAEAAGAVAVPERTRTLALAAAVVVPASVALVCWVAMSVIFAIAHRPDWLLPPGIGPAFVIAEEFGDSVMAAIGGPLLGLLLARYLPKRGVSAIAVVLLVVVTILLQGTFEGGQPYRVFWVWTYFLGQLSQGWKSGGAIPWHMATAPGNPYLWVLYLVVLCTLGVVTAVCHDPERDPPGRLSRIALGLAALAVVLGVLTMAVGFTEPIQSPHICATC
jgi:hypothetical protein